MKFATYLLPFFLLVSSSSAKDSTTRNRKLLTTEGGNTKSSKAAADGAGKCIFGKVARLRVVEALVINFYAFGQPAFGAGFALADRQHYVENYPEFEEEFLLIGDTIGIAWTSDELWEHSDIVGYFKNIALTYYPDGGVFAQEYGSLIYPL